MVNLVTVMGFILVSIAYNGMSHGLMDLVALCQVLVLLREFITHDNHGSKS